jgi:hypothetical protein
MRDMPPVGEVRLAANVVDELLGATLCLTFAYTNIRADVHPTIIATDATTSKGGACQADVPVKLARVLHRRAEMRSEHGYSRWSDMESELLPTIMERPSRDLNELLCSLPWRSPRGFHFAVIKHINIQELRALNDEVFRAIDHGLRDCKLIVCIDSRVVVGCVAKGRSSAVQLNEHLRTLASTCACAGVQVRVVWVGTEYNPADAPSRNRPLPEGGPMPHWVEQLYLRDRSRGDRRRLDAKASLLTNTTTRLSTVAAIVAIDDLYSADYLFVVFREYYAGAGHLSSQARCVGFHTAEFEAYPPRGYRALCDLSLATVVDKEVRAIGDGLVAAAHFGLKCKSWCKITQLYNSSTRTIASPMGSGILQREVLGNLQLLMMMRIVAELIIYSIPFTIENPHDSLL